MDRQCGQRIENSATVLRIMEESIRIVFTDALDWALWIKLGKVWGRPLPAIPARIATRPLLQRRRSLPQS